MCQRKIKHGSLIFIALIFCLARPQAQPEGIALRHITTDDGLSHNHVTGIVKDTQGFIWVGTIDGLTRFDGKRCAVFRPREGDNHSLPGNYITGLSLDTFGRMWVATNKGLCLWNYAARHFERFPLNYPDSDRPLALTPFVFDQEGFGWAGGDTFLVRLDIRSFQVSLYPLPLKYGFIHEVFEDSKGRMWVKAGGNILLYHRQSGAFEYKIGRVNDDLSKNVVAGHIREDEHGRIWCSSWGWGFFIYNEKTGEFDDYPDDTAVASVFFFDRDPRAGPIIWCGGGLYGLEWRTLLNGKSVPFPPRPREPFSHNNAPASYFFKDPTNGIVWIGTENGLEKYDPNDLRFTRIMLPDSFSMGQMGGFAGIAQDASQHDRYFVGFWVKGFYEWNRKTGEFKQIKNGLDNQEIFEVIQAKNGKVWLAERSCVQEFDPTTRRFRTFKPTFPTPGLNHKVLKVLEGRDGRIWFGCNYEGLYWLDPASGKFENVPLDGKKRYIRGLGEDPQGRILVGDSFGFLRYDPNTQQHEHFVLKDSSYFACNDFAFDRKGQFWIASSEGLLRFDDHNRIAFALGTHNGLQNDLIRGIEIDLEDRMWLATANGLHRYYPTTGAVNVYRRPDGVFNNDIADGYQMLPNGELFFGFNDAFNIANTSRLPMNPYPPRTALVEVLVLNKPFAWRLGERVVLRPGDNVVTFDFAALNFTQPEKTVLVYKLEGFNQDWAETQQNTITYTNLDGGNYTLLVRARNGDGIWSRETVRVELKVVPPFTKTVWFRLMLLGLAAAIIAGIAWYRQQQRLQLEAIRRRIARDLHDDMGSTVSSIRFFSELAQNQLAKHPAEAHNMLARINQSAATLSESIQDIVWAISARHDNIEDLAARIRAFGLKISEARNIQFLADIPTSFPALALRPDTRRNIYLIFKEAMNNAAKYAECNQVEVSLRLERRKLTLEIKDNGKGFDPASTHYGNGIANMRQRAADINGRLDVQTAPGKGVRIWLEVSI